MQADNAHKPDIVEVAKKKRHVYLYQKLHAGKPLSRAELKELKEFENPASLPPGYVDTIEKVAKVFGVAVRTAHRWIKEGLPKTKDGLYSIADIQEWRHARSDKKRKDSNGKINWDEILKQKKALLADIELKEKKGELVPLKKVMKEVMQEFSGIKQRMMSLPKILSPQVAGLDIHGTEEVIRRRIEEVINDFAIGDFGERIKKSKKRKKGRKRK